MSLVAGEDTESDEEINTDQLHETRGSGNKAKKTSPSPRAGLVAGEDSEEEDENVDGTGGGKAEPVAGSMDSIDQLQQAQTTKAAKLTWQPPSLMHKKLGDSNASLRKNIVDRILKLYHQTCRHLTDVNDNLTKTQAMVEKVNANVKKSDQDLEQVISNTDDIRDAILSFAPSLRMDIPIKTFPSKPLVSRPGKGKEKKAAQKPPRPPPPVAVPAATAAGGGGGEGSES